MLAQAKEQGASLVRPDGLLNQRTKNVLETVLTEIGPVEIEVPRDRDAFFEPVIFPKPKRRLDGIDQIVVSLCR